MKLLNIWRERKSMCNLSIPQAHSISPSPVIVFTHCSQLKSDSVTTNDTRHFSPRRSQTFGLYAMLGVMYDGAGALVPVLFGFEILEPFNAPFIATSVTDFWRRWNLVAGSALRQLIYQPIVEGAFNFLCTCDFLKFFFPLFFSTYIGSSHALISSVMHGLGLGLILYSRCMTRIYV